MKMKNCLRTVYENIDLLMFLNKGIILVLAPDVIVSSEASMARETVGVVDEKDTHGDREREGEREMVLLTAVNINYFDSVVAVQT